LTVDEPLPAPEPERAPRPRRSPWRWPRRIALAVVALAALAAAALAVLDSSIGHRMIVSQIAALRPSNGLRFQIGRIEGSIFGQTRLRDIRIYDPKGLVLTVPLAELDWNPFAWTRNRLDINRLAIPQATLVKVPETIKSGRPGKILPNFDIRVGALSVDRLIVGPKVTGVVRSGSLRGRADVHAGRALIELSADVHGSDRLRLKLDAEPDGNRFDADVVAVGSAKGVLAKLTGVAQPLAFVVRGEGDWQHWTGRAWASASGKKTIDLRLANQAGRYALSGQVAPGVVFAGRLKRLSAPLVEVGGDATFADRKLDGKVTLRSAALAVEAQGEVDLAAGAFRDLKIRTLLLQPAALFAGMTGKGVELRAILDGPFAQARFDYRIVAPRMAFGNTGFEAVRAGGAGRLGTSPVRVPILFRAARVTGVGEVAGGILRNLSVDGVLEVTGKQITGNKLRVRSDKLDAQVMLLMNLVTGDYQLGFAAGLKRYLIPGLGVVDVQTDLRIVPGKGGKGTHVLGKGAAQVLRLDNEFFRTLTGGLPRITTGIDRGPDGVFHFNNAVLTSPKLKLTGNGYRRNDGTFHFEGKGSHSDYGPLSLVLDGPIQKPKLDIKLARPNQAADLRDVVVHLDPTPEGFAFKAEGQSLLGAFAGTGAILLPPKGTPRIAVTRLDVAGTQVKGELAIVTGGFEGSLAFAGGGLDGTLALRPVDGVQQIAGKVAARRALIRNVTIAQADAEFTVLLDPQGTAIDATATARGVSSGGFRIGQLAATAKLVNGTGDVDASFTGARGRGFDLRTRTHVTPDSFRVDAQGTVDRRPLKLVTPAVIVRDGGGWRLQPTRIAFAGGEAQLGGRFGGGAASLDASLTRMPLSVLDVGFPGLGLGGSASGTLHYSDAGQGPSGRIDMTVRGMTRSGLVLSSTPIDVGLSGVLSPQKAAMRAVMASGGKTIGRAQARLQPLGAGDLVERLQNAPMFAQLRYAGPADTLWRLTGVELFDVSGPVSIGADMRGTMVSPQIQGSVRAQNAHLESGVTGTVLNNVQASGRFAGSKLTIDSFSAKDAKTGTVAGTGSFDFGAAKGLGIDLTLTAQNAVVINRDDIGATVSGPIRIRSEGDGGTISGDVTLTASRYQLGRAAAVAAAVPKLHVRERNRVSGAEEVDVPIAAPWLLDIHARAPGNMRVTGLGLSSEWAADLQIRGEPTSPIILGRADLIRGDFEFAGREFQLARGIIRFDGSRPANPSLDIAANGDAQGLSATIRVTGTANRTQIAFTSVPALPQDELLSRLLFGTSITQLSAPEAIQLASAVAALNSGSGGLDPINAVRRATGLDRLRILPADPTTGQGTAVAAGKYVTRRTYVEIVTDGAGYSATRVEFQVTRWLSLLATISTIGRQTATVRVSKDY